jgi:hypothetical protein
LADVACDHERIARFGPVPEARLGVREVVMASCQTRSSTGTTLGSM